MLLGVLGRVGVRDWAAIKFTTVFDKEVACARGKTGCPVCGTLASEGRNYKIHEDPALLAEEGTDTGRMVALGARVVWCLSDVPSLAAAWAASKAAARPFDRAVLEGNSILSVVRPEAILMAVHPTVPVSRFKPSAAPLLRVADAVVVNAYPGTPADRLERRRCEAREIRGRDDVRVASLADPMASWCPPDLLARLDSGALEDRASPPLAGQPLG